MGEVSRYPVKYLPSRLIKIWENSLIQPSPKISPDFYSAILPLLPGIFPTKMLLDLAPLTSVPLREQVRSSERT